MALNSNIKPSIKGCTVLDCARAASFKRHLDTDNVRGINCGLRRSFASAAELRFNFSHIKRITTLNAGIGAALSTSIIVSCLAKRPTALNAIFRVPLDHFNPINLSNASRAWAGTTALPNPLRRSTRANNPSEPRQRLG